MKAIYKVTDRDTGNVIVVEGASSAAQAMNAVVKNRFDVQPVTVRELMEATQSGIKFHVHAVGIDGVKKPKQPRKPRAPKLAPPPAAAVSIAPPLEPIASAEPSSTEPVNTAANNPFPWTQRAAQA